MQEPLNSRCSDDPGPETTQEYKYVGNFRFARTPELQLPQKEVEIFPDHSLSTLALQLEDRVRLNNALDKGYPLITRNIPLIKSIAEAPGDVLPVAEMCYLGHAATILLKATNPTRIVGRTRALARRTSDVLWKTPDRAARQPFGSQHIRYRNSDHEESESSVDPEKKWKESRNEKSLSGTRPSSRTIHETYRHNGHISSSLTTKPTVPANFSNGAGAIEFEDPAASDYVKGKWCVVYHVLDAYVLLRHSNQLHPQLLEAGVRFYMGPKPQTHKEGMTWETQIDLALKHLYRGYDEAEKLADLIANGNNSLDEKLKLMLRLQSVSSGEDHDICARYSQEKEAECASWMGLPKSIPSYYQDEYSGLKRNFTWQFTKRLKRNELLGWALPRRRDAFKVAKDAFIELRQAINSFKRLGTL